MALPALLLPLLGAAARTGAMTAARGAASRGVGSRVASAALNYTAGKAGASAGAGAAEQEGSGGFQRQQRWGQNWNSSAVQNYGGGL